MFESGGAEGLPGAYLCPRQVVGLFGTYMCLRQVLGVTWYLQVSEAGVGGLVGTNLP